MRAKIEGRPNFGFHFRAAGQPKGGAATSTHRKLIRVEKNPEPSWLRGKLTFMGALALGELLVVGIVVVLIGWAVVGFVERLFNR